MSETVTISIRTLTPIWTGDVNGQCSEIKETGIIGSMRWWYEAIVRGLGGYVCDSLNESCEFDIKGYGNALRSGKSIEDALVVGLKEVCPVCRLFGCGGWKRQFQLLYYGCSDNIWRRKSEIENVERLRKCKTPKNGYKTYQCPECGKKKYVPFTCKCRLCTSCGTKAANQWADEIHHKLLKVPHRHVVFTISDKLRELIKNPKYQKILFMASKITMEEMVASSNKKSKQKIKLKIGMIQVLQTYGADIKWNPHVHCIVRI